MHKVLLSTDIVDSTQLNTALGDAAMAALWQAHDRTARELIVSWRGQELARSDGFLILFDTANDGIGFAQAYHRALSRIDERMRARVGLHAGPVLLRPNSDDERARGAPLFEVDGVALPVTARVSAAAQAGQTLVTAAIVEALVPRPAHLKSHGHWRLKGLPEPVELFELADADALLHPPPDSAKAYRVVKAPGGWLPARAIAHSLPAERDPFVGRSAALLHLAELLDAAPRLVTVMGMGGIGKTRLALRYAWHWLGDYPGGAWFCDLSTARSLDGVVHAAAQGTGITLGHSDAVARIARGIAERGACLVILDNFEQVAHLAAATVGAWLERAPEAKFIVSSRELLGIPGEHAVVLEPMSAREGVDLFLQRSAAADGGIAHASTDDAAIEPLVGLLDGLPLAIELAAARSRVMSPSMLLRRMHARFELLASRRGRLDRQATLRATLDWSWDLLDPYERTALAQLAVFDGGFTLDAAEAVIELPADAPPTPVVDLLQSLADKSLLRRRSAERFDLLLSVQEYAAERLQQMPPSQTGGSAAAAAEQRHGAFFTGRRERDPVAYASRELDNLLSACRRAVARGALDDASSALDIAWAGLKLGGASRTAIELAATIRAGAPLDGRAVARLHRVNASALHALGRVEEAQREFEAGLALAAGNGDRLLEAEIRCSLGDLDAQRGRVDTAAAHFAAALCIAEALRDPELQCKVLNSLGSHHEALGDLEAAAAHWKAALAIAKSAGLRRWQGGALGNLGSLQTMRGEHREAEHLYQEAILIARELGDRRFEGNALCNLGLTLQALDRPAEARVQLDAALAVARQIGQRRLEAVTLCNIGILSSAVNETGDARAAFDQAVDVARQLGDRRSEGQFLTHRALLDMRMGDHEQARTGLARAQALLEAVSDRLSLGLALCAQAELEHLAGRREDALRALERADALCAETGASERSELGMARARARSVVA